MPLDRDLAYLWDMREAASSAVTFASGVRFEAYQADRKTQMAVERAVEIVGEAARRVSDDFKAAHPELPWRQMIAQRNVLAHEYGEIKQERLWLLVTDHLPALLAQLDLLLPSVPTGSKA